MSRNLLVVAFAALSLACATGASANEHRADSTPIVHGSQPAPAALDFGIGEGRLEPGAPRADHAENHVAKAGVQPGKRLLELRLDDVSGYEVGQEISVDTLAAGELVDVTAVSKGKGFAGVMKRHNFGGLRASHGVSISHRSHGSTGHRQDPGRVFKGKKMAGHLGDERITTQNLKVVSTDVERGLILIEGSVPGAPGGYVLVKDAVKRRLPKDVPFPAGLKGAAGGETAAAES